MRNTIATVGPLTTASATAVCASQTPTAAAGFTINGGSASGGVATLDTARRVLFTPSGDESANTFTVVGTALNGTSQTEVIAGKNATTFYTNLDFKTVTSISLASNAAAAITVGTNTVASSPWVRMDDYANAQVAIGTYVTGTVNYTIQGAYLDPNAPGYTIAPYNVPWINSTDSGAVSQTAAIQTTYAIAPTFIRCLLNSGSGTVATSITQYGMVSQ